MYISPSPSLKLRDLFSSEVRKYSYPLVDRNRNFYCYVRGCGALFYFLKNWEGGKATTALLPSYLCRDVLETFQIAGVPISFYGIDKNCKFDIRELEEKLDGDVKILYLVHFFGFPQSLDKVLKLAREKNVVIVEDCAHALFGKFGERWLGEFGDVAIFSLRKTLPIPDGGGLLINNDVITRNNLEAASCGVQYFSGAVKLLIKRLMWRLQCAPWHLPFVGPRILSFASAIDKRKTEVSLKRISSFSKHIFDHYDSEKVSLARRENFIYYLKAITQCPAIRPLFHNLPPGVVPFSFPVLVRNRDQLVEEMKNEGVWLNRGFPESGGSESGDLLFGKLLPGTEFLARHLLELPVHQDLDSNHLEKIMELLGALVQDVG